MLQLLTPEQIRAAFDARGDVIEHIALSTRPVNGHPDKVRALRSSWFTVGQVATLVRTHDVTPS